MKRNGKDAKKVLFIATILAVVVFGIEKYCGPNKIVELQRNSYGEGSKTETVEVQMEGEKEPLEITIEVNERQYSREELQQVFKQSMNQLEKLILGANEDVNHIDSPLNLISQIPGESIRVEWQFDNYDVLTLNGELREENISANGELVKLTAVLIYGEEQAIHEFDVRVYPSQEKEKTIRAELEEALLESDSLTKESEKYLLPNDINNKKVIWSKPRVNYSLMVLLLGIIMAVYFIMSKEQEERKVKKRRQEQMMIDYPEILNKLVLLLGAGMTVQRAWNQIAMNYEKQREIHGVRYAYEEMLYTCHELKSKIAETESYERFGKRCGVSEYIKFGALLSQNMKKGTAGLAKMLEIESKNAFEERKSQARRKGEDAGTKLLLPMFMMLGIVLIIIVIPAFLSFQL